MSRRNRGVRRLQDALCVGFAIGVFFAAVTTANTGVRFIGGFIGAFILASISLVYTAGETRGRREQPFTVRRMR